jgi:phosphatidate cytidylyltransferase
MVNRPAQEPVWVAVLFSLALTWGVALQAGMGIALILCLSLSLMLMLIFRVAKIYKPVLLSMGVSYLGSAMVGLMALRDAAGFEWTTTLCAIVWFTDTAAYFCGKTLRGMRLAPDISPSKTWTGFIGGISGALIAGFLLARLFSASNTALVCLIALGLSLAAHCGDLFESWVKRQAGVKDSGGIIPGHGGLLDRVDGMIMAVLAFWAVFWISGYDLSWWKTGVIESPLRF